MDLGRLARVNWRHSAPLLVHPALLLQGSPRLHLLNPTAGKKAPPPHRGKKSTSAYIPYQQNNLRLLLVLSRCFYLFYLSTYLFIFGLFLSRCHITSCLQQIHMAALATEKPNGSQSALRKLLLPSEIGSYKNEPFIFFSPHLFKKITDKRWGNGSEEVSG